MKNIFLISILTVLTSLNAFADARVMNAGQAYGQLVVLTVDDVKSETPKYKSLSPLSIPVFAELPLDMSVVAGAITLQQQTLLSHVQLKSRARGTPNLDISELQGGMSNALLAKFKDGDWIHLNLSADGKIVIEPSNEAQALDFYNSKKMIEMNLEADVLDKMIRSNEEMGSKDFVRVGSKAANYAELANLLNTPEKTVVRPSHGIPFYYYQEFLDSNPAIQSAIDSILRDPLMNKVAKVEYRKAKLEALQALMTSEATVVSEKLIEELIKMFDGMRTAKGKPRKIKLRSSTNSEDLPNFNGAGLYTSASYDPTTKGVEKPYAEKRASLIKALKTVWASVWNLRAYDERAYFRIPHAQVRMGMQVNPSYPNENADGVIVTKNMSGSKEFTGPGVYVEVQRGGEYSVTNPVAGIKPQKILINYDPANPLNTAAYKIHILQNSNIADDFLTILPQDNPQPVMTNEEIKDLTYQVMKAHLHFGPMLDPNNKDFSLDLEFKVDSEDTGKRQIYLKQARPYID
jgi:pyruvate, water dikinase